MIADRDDVEIAIAVDVADLALRMPFFLLRDLEPIGTLDQGDGSGRRTGYRYHA